MPEKQTTTSSSTTDPWAKQIPYLTGAFQNAQGIYQQGASNVYSGPQVAQFTPDQLNTFQRMIGYGSDLSPANSTAGAGSTLTSAGTNGVTGALNSLASFKPTGGTDSNITAAGQYADNPYISGQVTAAMRDANNNANENVLPGIARNAAAGGDINSNRTAIQQGIVQRGLAQQAGDISANLRGAAYNHGLDLGEQNSEFTNNAMLDALKSGGALGNSAASTGIGANSSAVGQAGDLFNLANVGGAGQQTAGQTAIDNAKATNEYGTDRLNQLLQQMYGIVGSNNWGGSTQGTSTSEKQASPFTIAGGLLGTAGGMFMPGFGGTSSAGNLYNLFSGGGFK